MLGRAVALGDVARYIRFLRSAGNRPRFGPWSQAVMARTIGSRHFTDPFGSLRILSSPRQRLMVLAAVRNKLASRPVIGIGDIEVREDGITIRRRRGLGNLGYHGLVVRAGGDICDGGRKTVDHCPVMADDAVPIRGFP
jgi:hypothetical protein